MKKRPLTIPQLVGYEACEWKLKSEFGDYVYCQFKLSKRCDGQMKYVCPSDCPLMKHSDDLLCDPSSCKSIKRWVKNAEEAFKKQNTKL